uniref:Secreted protein n=1 Tax=Meloidogyne javanica TaxID=6303 RepID=A0A915N1T1_MELJA
MYLFLLFTSLNIFYCVTALSVHVKISWRDNPKGLQILANKTRHRFKVELGSNKWEFPKEGETDKYDTFHFEEVEENNDENLGKYSLKVYKALNKNSITEIASIDNVKDNSLIYIKIEEDAVLQFLPNHQKPNSLLGKHKRDEDYE